MCRNCYCTDDEAYKYGECFCLCHTRESIGEGPVSLYTVPKCGGGALILHSEGPLSNRLSTEWGAGAQQCVGGWDGMASVFVVRLRAPCPTSRR
jgi:hypothetical protein